MSCLTQSCGTATVVRQTLVCRWAKCAVVIGFALAIVSSGAFAKVYVNPNYPIQSPTGSPLLSPPFVEQTNECSTHVYVESFIPGATINVYLGGTTLIGTATEREGFAAVKLTVELATGASVTATQTVNGVTSAPSAPMIAGAMPPSLSPPSVDPGIYACGRVVPVHGLVSGVTVQVKDETTNKIIGSGYTPNVWGSDWDPALTSSLTSGDLIQARQLACTGIKSAYSPAEPVQVDPSPLLAPTLDTPIVGNNTITANGLYTGSLLQAFDVDGATTTQIGEGYSTTSSNWMNVGPPVRPLPHEIAAEQTLCTHSPQSTPLPPTTIIPAVELLGPICPGQSAAYVRNSTINATLVLVKNGVTVGYGGAAPGDVPLNLAPPFTFAEGDVVQVIEYIQTSIVSSNTVVVGCTNVVTYHNDAQRTGWNPNENTLTPANVTSATFGHIVTVPLDDQVDTEPLVVSSQPIQGAGTHSVAYVTTENNSIYAIDAWSGDLLLQQNFGAPVPMPQGCNNNGPNVGINGTQTIDLSTNTIYLMVYTFIGGNPAYQLHALNASTLTDLPGSPVTVSAVQTLSNGSLFPFNATYQRQRSALLEANGNVYAGFASFCDFDASNSRGWVLGWKASTLAPLSVNELTNTYATAPSVDCTYSGNHPCFLSSVWMSGYGLAADPDNGSLYFTTGNSASGTYNSSFNISETAAKMSGDLSTLEDYFTPADVNSLDSADEDYGSGGVLVLPDYDRQFPHLAAAAGKEGNLFVLNRDNLGKFNAVNFPLSVGVGSCWCGPSYFQTATGEGVVSSGGSAVELWSPIVSGGKPSLSFVASASVNESSPQDPGFFTSISSNGTTANSAIIWALGRAAGNDNHVTLWAFNATPSGGTLPQLWSGIGGYWPNTGGNSNLVPTVANGRVLVASDKQLQIFGLIEPGAAKRAYGELAAASARRTPSGEPSGPQFWGTVRGLQGNQISLQLRTGRLLQVDIGPAVNAQRAISPFVGERVLVKGVLNADGSFAADTIVRAKGESSWGKDTTK